MKKLLLFLLVFNFGFSQDSDVEIRLVNANVGTPLTMNYGTLNVSYTSNDQGLNNILNAYGATQYILKSGGHPYQPYQGRIVSIPGVFPAQFLIDLQAYSSVIESARISNTHSFSDALLTTILNDGIGIPTGTIGNIVQTNDSGLNQIFQDYNVFYFAKMCPNCSTAELLRVYDIVCNCNNNLLKIALDNYSAIIATSSTYITPAAYLGSKQFDKYKTSISPNPFTTNFNIQTEEVIFNYSLIDISGKQLINTTSKNELDNLSSQLNSGVYFLYIQFENGQKENYKLIKK